MPTTSRPHRKSRLGCERCKARKVKCDEAKPRCSACERHGTQCIYPQREDDPNNVPRPNLLSVLPTLLSPKDPSFTFGQDANTTLSRSTSVDGFNAGSLEMRLLHFFVARTSETLSSAVSLWKIRVPLVAFERPPVFDLTLALAALHVIREKQHCGDAGISHPGALFIKDGSFFGEQSVDQLRAISEDYFQRGVQTHNIAIGRAVTYDDYEAAVLGSILISVYSLFMLGDIDMPSTAYSENLWLKLGMGPREVSMMWMASAGNNVIEDWGLMDNKPDLMNDPELTNEDNARDFLILLETGREYEVIEPDDAAAYEQMLIYLGLMYNKAITRTESSRETCRRLLAVPFCAHPRFKDLVRQQRPRALAMLIFAFAIGKLIEDDMVILKGVAQNQIPALYARLPSAWTSVLAWPVEILQTACSPGMELPRVYFT